MPVAGCESPWQQADSALVYDSSGLGPADVASVGSLFAWAAAHPGRFTYPAPPDFTGSMAVRTFLYDTAGGASGLTTSAQVRSATAALWPRLQQLEPALWRSGQTYPAAQSDVEKLYASGEISAYLTYGPGAVADQVARGVYPASTREAVLDVGNIANTSFVAIPADAAHAAAAMVVANQLLDPATQLELFTRAGIYPVIDLATVPAATRSASAAVDLGPAVLPLGRLTAHTLPELPAADVATIEQGWTRNVLQR